MNCKADLKSGTGVVGMPGLSSRVGQSSWARAAAVPGGPWANWAVKKSLNSPEVTVLNLNLKSNRDRSGVG